MNPKFPHVTVKLLGEDGNAFFILGAVIKAMRRAKVSEEDITKLEKKQRLVTMTTCFRLLCHM